MLQELSVCTSEALGIVPPLSHESRVMGSRMLTQITLQRTSSCLEHRIIMSASCLLIQHQSLAQQSI